MSVQRWTWLKAAKLGLMFSYLRTWLRLIRRFLYLQLATRRILREARNDIQEARLELKFSENIEHRLWQYTIFHGFLAFILADFKSKKLSKSELDRFSYLSVCAPLFDDLSDHWDLDQQHIVQLIAGNEIDKMPALASEKAEKYWQHITDNLNQRKEEKLLDLIPALAMEQRTDQSSQKGALGMVLYATLMDDDFSNQEIEWLNRMGELGQMIDDIFDYYKDQEQGISTWAHQFSINELEDQFFQEICQMVESFENIEGHRTHKTSLEFHWLNTILLSSPLVAIDYFKRHRSEAKKYKTPIVCDMEKISNRIKLIQYSWTLGIRLRNASLSDQ